MNNSFQTYLNKNGYQFEAKSVTAVLELHADGGTVPFIARYRKEKTGNLDEVQIRQIIDGFEKYDEIIKRREFLIKEIGGQGNLTPELKLDIEKTWTMAALDELYRPFKKKKKTKATIAKEAGLEPLATWICELGHGKIDDKTSLEVKAKDFLNPAKEIVTYEVALKGAQDIIVDKIANETTLREATRQNFFEHGKIFSRKGKKFKDNSKFDMYKEFSEDVKTIQAPKASHRYMALRRGWQEGELTVTIKGDEDLLLSKYKEFICTAENQSTEFLQSCAKLALTTHVTPSVSNEVHRFLKDKADLHGVHVFAENVRKVLLASPFGANCVLGVDPGIKTGCKIALVDKQGAFISNTVLHITGNSAHENAKTLFSEVLKQVSIEAVAVGNGTGGREAEVFLRKVLEDLGKKIPVIMVNESGASVYSASEVAREEFPDLDLTVRGAISIARRLQDPLAELVKIDPKSIGVGQYQHDVSQALLKKELHYVVEDCVNQVGVDVNTASSSLLSYVAGVGPVLAKNIVEYRKKNGLFEERSQFQNIPKFSSKTFEQAAGFLRINDGKVFLDSTGIHPERYSALKDMASELKTPLSKLSGEGAQQLKGLKEKWVPLVGEYTFDDIVTELEKPGRDPRDPFKVFSYRDDIHKVQDLKEGMICPGIVTNVTNFGAFVDIGVHQDGLIHISELTYKFVDDPRKVVNSGDQVKVKVIGVDVDKKQISLSMKLTEKAPVPKKSSSKTNSKGKTASHRGKGKSVLAKGKNAGKPRGGKPGKAPVHGRRPKPAFNNPFAGLADLKDLKKN